MRWVPLGLIVALVAVVVGLLVWHSTKPGIANGGGAAGPDQASIEADVSSVTKACAMGGTASTESSVKADLAKYFQGLSAGAKVTSSDIGALAEKVTPTTSGVDLYKAYTDCLKEQMAIALSRRGIAIVQAGPSDIEKINDQRVESEISEINPDTPPARLVQIFGQPISSGEAEAEGVHVDRYQYKFSAFAADYSKAGKRVGIVLATKIPNGFHLDQLTLNEDNSPDVTLGSLDCDGGFQISAHRNINSGVCGGSHADSYIYSVYLFLSPEGAEETKPCRDFMNFGTHAFDAKSCPKLATHRALAVAISYDSDGAATAAQEFMNDLDFGSTFRWRDPVKR